MTFTSRKRVSCKHGISVIGSCLVWCVLFGVLDFRYERICFKLTLEDEFAVVKTV